MGTRKQLVCDKCGEDLTKDEGFLEVERTRGRKYSGYLKPSVASKSNWAFCTECWMEILLEVDLAEEIKIKGMKPIERAMVTKGQIEGYSLLKKHSEKFGEDNES